MSIYRGHRRLLSDVQIEDASEQRGDGSASQKTRAPPVHLRRAKPLLVLLARTQSWIESLPEKVKPHALATQYARIANQVCGVWEQPPACRDYFSELLSDRRGGRKGFPSAVLRDLQALQTYHADVYPVPDSDPTWDGRSVWDGSNRE